MTQSKDRLSTAEHRSYLQQKFMLLIIALTLLVACSGEVRAYIPENCEYDPLVFRVSLNWNGETTLIDGDDQEVFSAWGTQTSDGDQVVIDVPGNGDEVAAFLAVSKGSEVSVDGYTFTVDEVDGNEVVVEMTLSDCPTEE